MIKNELFFFFLLLFVALFFSAYPHSVSVQAGRQAGKWAGDVNEWILFVVKGCMDEEDEG